MFEFSLATLLYIATGAGGTVATLYVRAWLGKRTADQGDARLTLEEAKVASDERGKLITELQGFLTAAVNEAKMLKGEMDKMFVEVADARKLVSTITLHATAVLHENNFFRGVHGFTPSLSLDSFLPLSPEERTSAYERLHTAASQLSNEVSDRVGKDTLSGAYPPPDEPFPGGEELLGKLEGRDPKDT